VEEDDRTGREIREKVFGGRWKTERGFSEVKEEILSLLSKRVLRLVEV